MRPATPVFRNRLAAPHLRAIGPAYVREVRGAGPLAQICGTAKRLQAGRNAPVIALPGERLRFFMMGKGFS